jgi:hypothetical protein
MATYDQLMIYKQAYDLTTALMPMTKNMDRGYKYTLGERINNASVEMLISVYRINTTYDNRERYFTSAREQVELVRLLLRLMKDLHIVTISRFTRLNEIVESISKQLTGWQRSTHPVDSGKQVKNRAEQSPLF